MRTKQNHFINLAIFAFVVVMLLGLSAAPAKKVFAAKPVYDVQVTGKLMRSHLPKLLGLINEARRKEEAPDLQFDAKAMKIAELRAAQASLCFTHNAPDLGDPESWDLIEGEPVPSFFRFIPVGSGTSLPVGRTTLKHPYYYQSGTSGSGNSAYYFDSACGEWTSSDPGIASVAEDGTVTGLSPGKATITFALNGDEEKSVSYDVNVRFDLIAPANLMAERKDGKVTLSWDALNLADGYEVSKCRNEFGTYQVIGTTTDTMFEAPAETGTIYYIVKGYGKFNGVAYYGLPTLGLEVEASGLPAPAGLTTVDVTSSKIRAKWKKVAGAYGYQIQVSSMDDFSSRTSCRTRATEKTMGVEKTGTAYYIRTRAYSKSGGTKRYGPWSEKRSGARWVSFCEEWEDNESGRYRCTDKTRMRTYRAESQDHAQNTENLWLDTSAQRC